VFICFILAWNSFLVYPSLPYHVNPTSLFQLWGNKSNREQIETIGIDLGIIMLELMTPTTSRWYSTVELYPYPKENLLISRRKPKSWKIKSHYPIVPKQLDWSQALLSHMIMEIIEKIESYCQSSNPIENMDSSWFKPLVFLENS